MLMIFGRQTTSLSRSPLAKKIFDFSMTPVAAHTGRKVLRLAANRRPCDMAHNTAAIRASISDDRIRQIDPELIAVFHRAVEKIADELTKRKVATPRGGRWHGRTVARLLDRLYLR